MAGKQRGGGRGLEDERCGRRVILVRRVFDMDWERRDVSAPLGVDHLAMILLGVLYEGVHVGEV
jgi:hypothetical protein